MLGWLSRRVNRLRQVEGEDALEEKGGSKVAIWAHVRKRHLYLLLVAAPCPHRSRREAMRLGKTISRSIFYENGPTVIRTITDE